MRTKKRKSNQSHGFHNSSFMNSLTKTDNQRRHNNSKYRVFNMDLKDFADIDKMNIPKEFQNQKTVCKCETVPIKSNKSKKNNKNSKNSNYSQELVMDTEFSNIMNPRFKPKSLKNQSKMMFRKPPSCNIIKKKPVLHSTKSVKSSPKKAKNPKQAKTPRQTKNPKQVKTPKQTKNPKQAKIPKTKRKSHGKTLSRNELNALAKKLIKESFRNRK
jgi:hypothetical protein